MTKNPIHAGKKRDAFALDFRKLVAQITNDCLSRCTTNLGHIFPHSDWTPESSMIFFAF
jgi:hypothetical protein